MKSENIIVVGGGTAGLISALILKTRFPQKKVEIIQSSSLGIVGVGESSTEHWRDFCQFVGIPLLDVIIKAKATFKYGVYFEGWGEHDFVHSVAPAYEDKIGNYYPVFAHIISNNLHPHNMHPHHWLRNKVSLDYFNNFNDSPTYQFQFDTYALNQYLHDICKERGIGIIDDNLIQIKYHRNGNISCVISDTNKYYADFFIDCSGFKRFLTKDIPWVSYRDYLPLNSAIAFSTDEMEDYNTYTKSTRRKFGWSWTIPTQNRTGNGYVFSDKFVEEEKVYEEMEEVYNHKLHNVKSFKFDPGRLESAWNKNCYAVGLSQSFVEPLEATSIGSVVQQMFCFIHYLPSYDAQTCNVKVNLIFDNIFDFVQSHYLIKEEDSLFWKEIKYNLKLTKNLESYLEVWKNRLPQSSDINCDWGLFSPANYIFILYGLGWFDIDKVREEYLHYNIQSHIEEHLKGCVFDEENLIWVKHKEIINLICANKKSGY